MRAGAGAQDASTGWALAWEERLQRSGPGLSLGPGEAGLLAPDGQMTPRASLAAFCTSAQAPPGEGYTSFVSTVFYGLWTSFAGIEFGDGAAVYVRGEEVADLEDAERSAATGAVRYFSANLPGLHSWHALRSPGPDSTRPATAPPPGVGAAPPQDAGSYSDLD